MTMPTEAQRDAAGKLGRLAARRGRSVTSCPFPVDGDPADRVLAARFVAGFVAAGGTVDGMELGDQDRGDVPRQKSARGRPAERPFGHLGY